MTAGDLDARIALTGAVAHLLAARASCTPETREALDVVLGYVQEHEQAGRTEWGIRWDDDEVWEHGNDRGSAEREQAAIAAPGVLVSREDGGPWTAVES